MRKRTSNRMYQDSLFRMLFQDKEELLILYNAIRGTSYTNVDDLEVNTLEDVIYMSMKNDISFVVDGNLSLYEHQSTYNGNMPLRNLLYIANLYFGMTANENLYGNRTIPLPTPNFVVFYNGSRKLEERTYKRLSEAYITNDECNLELTVLILNINQGYNQELMSKCKTLAEYITYVDTVKRNSKTMPIEEAVEQAITDCINNIILAEFLRKHKAEVEHVSIFEYDAKKHIEMERAEAKEEGYDTGYYEGREEERKENQRRFRLQISKKVQKSKSLQTIADELECEPEEIRRIYEEIVGGE